MLKVAWLIIKCMGICHTHVTVNNSVLKMHASKTAKATLMPMKGDYTKQLVEMGMPDVATVERAPIATTCITSLESVEI